jgi:transposase InsO family protein
MSESLQPDHAQRPDPGPVPAPDQAPDEQLTDLEPPPPEQPDISRPRLTSGARRHRRALRPPDHGPPTFTPQQRLLILDAWQRSGLPAGDFAPLVGISKHTLYAWKKRFDQQGPAGLLDLPKGAPAGSRLPDLTQRTILLLKQSHPDWGCQRIADMLQRGPALPASPQAVARVLHEAGYSADDLPAHPPHDPPVRHFERARPNQLWQTDLFTFILKRQNRRVYLVAFLDDHSRFITGYGLHASQSTALVLEVLRAALDGFGCPEEILTDNGSQYVTWRGQSAFHKELSKRGIRQVVAAPRHPQTLGKIERFWGSLWRECVEAAVFTDLGDARRRIGLYIDHYNFRRPHQGIDAAVPADRFFAADSVVRQTLEARVAANALELARHGLPRPPFYLAGQAGGRDFSLHAEGERVILTDAAGNRQEVELGRPAAAAPTWPEPVCPSGDPVRTAAEEAVCSDDAPVAPGQSALDEPLVQLREQGLAPREEGGHE